jgi:hypothetical protein
MKTHISKRNFSFRLLLVFLATVGFLTMPGLCITSVRADDIPYDPNEVQKLRAFLASQSMTPGKTNADLLGMDINNPGAWAKWGGNDWIPRPPAQHAVDIQWKHNSLAGSLDISGFQYLGYFVLDCFDDVTNKFDNITISNNPGLVWGVILHSVKVNELRITGNEGLHHLELNGKVDVLTLDQPDLGYLDIGTLGNIPPDLTKCTKLQTLKLSGIKNIPNWNIANFPNLETVYLDGLKNITSLNPINCPKLGGIGINNMPALESIKLDNLKNLVGITLSGTSIKELDLSCAPNLVTFGLFFDSALTTLKIKDKPRFQFLELKGNQALRSLEISGSDSLAYFRCHYNEKLEEIILTDLPKLGWIMAFANAFKKIDISGLPAIKDVWLSDNQLTEFKAEGVVLEHLDLKSNKLTEVSANVGGHKIHLKAYGKGGYVGFDAGPGYWKPYGIQLECKELPAPNNTILKEVKGTGFPPKKNDYEGGFLFEKDIDATFYFKADIYFVNYFGDLEGDLPDEDEGEWDSEANLDYQSLVGNPFKLPEEYPLPVKTGFEIKGWYTDTTLTHEWIFDKDTLRGELILYPNWIPSGMPTVLSVKRQTPTEENTSADHVTYLVTFSKTVTGVDVSDFKLTSEGTVSGKIASVSAANGHEISIEVNGITGTGTLRLDVKSTGTGIVDADSNPLANGYISGEIFRLGPATAIDNDIQAEKGCRVFPNPTSGIIQICTPNNEPVNRIEVFNIQGKQVLFIDHPQDNNLDLSRFSNGIYLVKILIKSGFYNHKIVKH